MDTMYPIRTRFLRLQSLPKNGYGSLTEICKKNSYYHLQSYDKIQLIHIILNQEYRSDYDDFINFTEFERGDFEDRQDELYKMKMIELRNILKNYKLTQNGCKIFLIKRIMRYEFYNKIVTYEQQTMEEANIISSKLTYLPELNYFNSDYSENYNRIYKVTNIYDPLDFYNIDEYIYHLENLRILNKNELINRHFESLSEDWFRLVKYNLIQIGWEFYNHNYDDVILEAVNDKYRVKEENANVIENIKEFCYNSEEKCDCMICMENIEKNELCKKLGCNHTFHSGCINSWLSRNLECPLCRNVIT